MTRYTLQVSWYGRISTVILWAINYEQLLFRLGQSFPGAVLVKIEYEESYY